MDAALRAVQQRFRVGSAVLRNLARGFAEEVGHTAARIAGRYDVAPANLGH